MIGHQHIGMQLATVPSTSIARLFQIELIICILNKDRLAVVTALNYVLREIRNIEPGETSHSGKLAHRRQSIASDPIDPRFTSQAVHFRTAANIEATSNSSREGPNALIPVRIPTRTLFTCPLPV